METVKTNNTTDKKAVELKKMLREDKQRVEDQIEKLIKNLGNSGTTEQKLAIIAKNFIELERDHHKQTASLKQNEKQIETVQREKEHLQKEYNKGVLMRDKLEQVCREQQKLMKSVKSESLSRIRDEEEKRKETQAHFQQSINEIFTTLGKNNEENTKLKEANLEMTKKFKFLAEQYELREKQLEKINEQINLETQLNEAKLAKVKMEATIEKEILLKEKEAAYEDLMKTKKAIIDTQTREQILKDQLNLYTEKYEGFQNSLQKSNDIFITYKNEIEKMAKRTKALEKECLEWRAKFEKNNRALLEMATDKQAQDQYVGRASRQIAQLRKLCHVLQAERASLLDTLKANNIERPPMPELPPEPTDIEPPPKSADKLDIMSRNCAELKKSLAQLQGQMNSLAAEKPSTADTPAQKKNKNKKNKSKTCPIKERIQANGFNEEKPVVKGRLPTEAAQEIDDERTLNDSLSALTLNNGTTETLQPVTETAVINTDNNDVVEMVAPTENNVDVVEQATNKCENDSTPHVSGCEENLINETVTVGSTNGVIENGNTSNSLDVSAQSPTVQITSL